MNTRQTFARSDSLIPCEFAGHELSRLIGKEAGAWEAFQETFEPLLYSAASAAVRRQGGRLNTEDIKEIVQDTYARLLRDDCRALKSYDPRKSALSTWLYRLAQNVAIDRLRRSRPETVPLSDALGVAGSEHSGPGILEGAGECLSSNERVLMRLLFNDGLSPQAAAERLGIAVQTVYSRKSKALNKLRKYLKRKRASGQEP